MFVRILQRLDPFRQLRLPELQTVARHAQVLNLPAGRWLLRSPRKLSGAYYLLRGRLDLWQPQQLQKQLSAQDPMAAAAFYPGCIAAQTSSPVQVLHINTAPIAFLWEVVYTAGLQTPVPDDAWLDRFLNSPMLQQLDPMRWQQLLRGATHALAHAGEVVVRLGEPGQAFYVLKRGRALVERAGQSLALLGPGDFFGEDALVTDKPRNATVTMQTAGELLVLPKQRFLRFLVAYIVGQQGLPPRMAQLPLLLWVAEQPPPERLSESTPQTPAVTHLPLQRFRERLVELDPKRFYRVVGGSFSERALALLLLAQQGFQADYAQSLEEDSYPQPKDARLSRHGPIASPVAQLGNALGAHDRHGVGSVDSR